MPKYSQRYFKPEGFKFKDNWYVGFEWTVPGSKAGTDYTVTLLKKALLASAQALAFTANVNTARK